MSGLFPLLTGQRGVLLVEARAGDPCPPTLPPLTGKTRFHQEPNTPDRARRRKYSHLPDHRHFPGVLVHFRLCVPLEGQTIEMLIPRPSFHRSPLPSV